jgi:glycerophosphoryl diester phosphodiesterase
MIPIMRDASRMPSRAAGQAPGRTLILGHRGASSEAPENTLAAFDLALQRGADGIEFDVRLSADGVPMVMHDARLERTTSGRGRVDALSERELRRLDAGTWFNERYPARARARFRGQKIPLLAEALAWVKERSCLAYLEIKRERDAKGGFEEKVLAAIHGAGVPDRVVVISFQPEVLERIRALDGQIALGLDCTRPLLAVRRAQMAGARVLLPLGALVTRKFVARAHAGGLQVAPWGVETPRAWRRLLGIGVDALITNRPAALSKLAGSAQRQRVARAS